MIVNQLLAVLTLLNIADTVYAYIIIEAAVTVTVCRGI